MEAELVGRLYWKDVRCPCREPVLRAVWMLEEVELDLDIRRVVMGGKTGALILSSDQRRCSNASNEHDLPRDAVRCYVS